MIRGAAGAVGAAIKLIDKKTLNGPLAANFKKRLTELFDEREYEKKKSIFVFFIVFCYQFKECFCCYC